MNPNMSGKGEFLHTVNQCRHYKMWKSFKNTNNKTTVMLSNPTSGCMPKGNASVSVKRQLHACVYCGFIHQMMYCENMIRPILFQ